MPKPSKVPLRVAAPPPRSADPVASGRPAKPTRRTFSAAEKLSIVREADACAERGQVEALRRRAGGYSYGATYTRAPPQITGRR
jgi:hypothetical protein